MSQRSGSSDPADESWSAYWRAQPLGALLVVGAVALLLGGHPNSSTAYGNPAHTPHRGTADTATLHAPPH